jgi:hypothetical protein
VREGSRADWEPLPSRYPTTDVDIAAGYLIPATGLGLGRWNRASHIDMADFARRAGAGPVKFVFEKEN